MLRCNPTSLLSSLLSLLACFHTTTQNIQGEVILSGAGNTFQGLDPNNWTGNGGSNLSWWEGQPSRLKQQQTAVERRFPYTTNRLAASLIFLSWPLKTSEQNCISQTLNVISAFCHRFMKWIWKTAPIPTAMGLLFDGFTTHLGVFISCARTEAAYTMSARTVQCECCSWSFSWHPLTNGGCLLTSSMTFDLLSCCEWCQSGIHRQLMLCLFLVLSRVLAVLTDSSKMQIIDSWTL